MKVAVLYRSNSEHERLVSNFEREFEYRTGRSFVKYDVNTRDGAAMASLYDVMRYPSVLALADDGQMLQMWQGDTLPLINEVTYYSPAMAG
ncbi:MAG TPA: hypothetical protein PLJ04_02545 [Candidatus Saccharibacteria bacterium]|nr:hypothetical protein [Candidatus Saccharibacteria bacterium]MCB9817339.1 hypothetical protein [Candidatus Nomurabacteria bacterium]HPD98731.1 hypothetical protein [Candidatus Saccharibacteria bacterium]HPR10438.1 hypothetical protein [Candidatus Saccharibacteria bacterium]